ncbi:hypothetical protein [Pelomonas sp. SE-A7]|uniref:hypothetical protein n=1 Tax=Pelomonas sp. SE-A7 TaxID=3054953 RepID=UPI00259CCB86|nr:hypothetical protein [Pelomonas sp. SE-A7]MDM4768480.1 hypothetical protein [Pelomonas sp. SE-A7]
MSNKDERELEAWLAQGRLDPVPDEGFTASVMQRLTRQQRRWSWARRGPVIGAAMGTGLLALQLSVTGLPTQPALLAAAVLGLTGLAILWAYVERES